MPTDFDIFKVFSPTCTCTFTGTLVEYLHIPQVKRIIFNNPATIVYWQDGSKTVVKCEPDTEFNEYTGFEAAVCKKLFGNNSKIKSIVDKYKEVQNEKSGKHSKD